MKLFVYSLREFDEKQYFDAWCEKYGVTYRATAEGPHPDNLSLAKGYDAVSIITTPLDREMLAVLKEGGVKCISTRTVGYDHIDMEAARELGLTICNAPYPPNSVANYTIMLMLMCCRKVTHILQRSALQDYSLKGKIGMELSNCTVGIVGTGKIGRTVLAHLKGFGCRLLAHDLYPSKEVEGIAEYTDLDTLYRESDIISLHMPSTADNFHMIDEAALSKMKDGVILINTARGSLIDSQAMIRGLESGKIGAAGLDVIENETELYYFNLCGKPMDNHELALLKAFPNVVVTPHTAFYTMEAVEHMVKNSIAGCLHALSGEENPFQV
ncbi:MAG: D-isomer specific 2-hydroxyacid dehydrogenase family protein [Lachnospiraceae bacterium]